MGVAFHWSRHELDSLLATCERDGVAPLVAEYISPGSRVLEAGCGPGRYVKYLADRDYHATGVELSPDTVAMAREVWPDCDVRTGDVTALDFADGTFDAVLSLGVVEHFPDGPAVPLREITRVLRAGGVAIITVPCLNHLRVIKRALWLAECRSARAVVAAALRRRPQPLTRLRGTHPYAVFPACGEFFEYRMTRRQFASEVASVGLRVVAQRPIGGMDGIFHELNPFGRVVQFVEWEFRPTPVALWLDACLGRWPYLHPHMQVVVAVKP